MNRNKKNLPKNTLLPTVAQVFELRVHNSSLQHKSGHQWTRANVAAVFKRPPRRTSTGGGDDVVELFTIFYFWREM